MNYHLHVYRISGKAELDIDAPTDMKAREIALAKAKNNEVEWASPESTYIAMSFATGVRKGDLSICAHPLKQVGGILIEPNCPCCHSPLTLDEVDIGVGIQRGNPRCDNCGWSPGQDQEDYYREHQEELEEHGSK